MDTSVKIIGTVRELMQMEPGGSYVLDADLDLEGQEWLPIGSDETPFCGSLDGRGHSISNFRILRTDSAGNTGLFGVNAGTVSDLTIRNAELQLTLSGEAAIGMLAGRNEGTFCGICVENSRIALHCQDAAVVRIGGLAGCSSGSFRNIRLDAAMNVDAGDADVCAAGLVAAADGGLLECVEIMGEWILNGTSVHAALFGGTLADTLLRACRFSAPMNLLNGAVFTNYALEETGSTGFDGCLWRDNRNSDRLLPKEALRIRQICSDHMHRMGSHKWTPNKTLRYRCSCGCKKVHEQVFEAGQTYFGMPYAHKQGSYEQFLECFRADGTLQPWVAAEGYDGFDLYMGNDCSGSIYWAWGRVCSELNYRWTENMMPCQKMGVLPVGSYDGMCAQHSDDVIKANTEEVIAEAYAQTHIGDAILKFGSKGGHVRMLCENAVIYRDRNGKISTKRSYLTTDEQGDGLLGDRSLHSSWLLNKRYKLSLLLQEGYIPVTTKTLLEGHRETPSITLQRKDETLLSCVIRSNYRILSVDVQIRNADREPVWTYRHYTAVCTYDEEGHDGRPREPVREVRLSELRPFIPGRKMQTGNVYVCRLWVRLSTGEVFQQEDIKFVW